MKSFPRCADKDIEARSAIWKAICVAADDVLGSYNIKEIIDSEGKSLRIGSVTPDVATWRLVEALSLLGTILRSDEAESKVISIFGKEGPIEIQENGKYKYLWIQHTLHGEKSELKGRPDLIITSTSELPTPRNISRIVEVKSERQLGTKTIRAEFGKAYDLRVASYLIWSYFTPATRIIEGAKRLGIDVEPLGFDTEKREKLLKDSDALIARIVYFQEQSDLTQRFAKKLSEANESIRLKLLSN